MNKSITSVQPRLLQHLVSREWKGEVRELENFVERLMIFADGSQLGIDSLPAESRPTLKQKPAAHGATLKQAIGTFEKDYIIEELARHNWHRGKTAKSLGVGEATLYRKMNQFQIDATNIENELQ